MKYTIKKGRHYAAFTINRLFPFSSRSKEGSIKFSKECLASAEIHKNSGRLVWRSNGNSIMISGYVYMNGVRREMLITSIDVDKWYDFSIEYSNKVWRFSVNGRQILMSGYLPSNVLNFKCFPYFGGQSVAPQTMYVWVK